MADSGEALASSDRPARTRAEIPEQNNAPRQEFRIIVAAVHLGDDVGLRLAIVLGNLQQFAE